MKVNDVFYLPCWEGKRVYHQVHVTYVNPDNTVTVQDDQGHIWFGVHRKELVDNG
jgi:hypothetical protein